MPQQFILKGHHIEVKYTIGITPGLIAVPAGQAFDFTTTAVREEFSGPNSVPHRATIWHCFPMHGTVKEVIGPL